MIIIIYLGISAILTAALLGAIECFELRVWVLFFIFSPIIFLAWIIFLLLQNFRSDS